MIRKKIEIFEEKMTKMLLIKKYKNQKNTYGVFITLKMWDPFSQNLLFTIGHNNLLTLNITEKIT